MAILTEHFATADWPSLMAMLPGRSQRVINGKAHGMGLRRPAPPPRSAEATLAAKREGMARRRAADPEAARLRGRAYHAANRPKQIAKMRAYYGRRFFWAKSMKLRGISPATPQDLALLWRRQRGLCALTGRRLDRTAEIDHRLPRARGGGDEIANLQWVTREANRAKRDLTDAEFLALCSDCMRWIGQRIASVEASASAGDARRAETLGSAREHAAPSGATPTRSDPPPTGPDAGGGHPERESGL